MMYANLVTIALQQQATGQYQYAHFVTTKCVTCVKNPMAILLFSSAMAVKS